MTEEASEETAPPETLENLAAQFTVSEPAPTQAPPAAPIATEPPQFESPEAASEWQAKQLVALSSSLNSVTEQLDAKTQQEFVDSQDQAVNSAVETIRQEVEMPDEMIEGQLHVKYSRDANFRKIFDNRAQNPAAFQKALGVVAAGLKAQSLWTPDAQGAEDARALKDFQRNANRAPSVTDKNQKYKDMSNHDFNAEWERLKNG